MTDELLRTLGDELYVALRERHTLAPLSERYSQLTIDDAYRISQHLLQHRQSKDGEKVVGKKIGVTSKAVQEMLGVFQPDFGFLTDAMQCCDQDTVAMNTMIQPRIEAEIAFELKSALVGPGVSAHQVLEATKCVYPCFEVVDSRIEDWRINIIDTVADNASCGVYALGAPFLDPTLLDLPNLETQVYRNGQLLHTGYGSAVQGNPLNAVAWLANTLGAYQIALNSGEIILSGSLVPLTPVHAGEHFEMKLLAPNNSQVLSDKGADSTLLGTTDLRFN